MIKPFSKKNLKIIAFNILIIAYFVFATLPVSSFLLYILAEILVLFLSTNYLFIHDVPKIKKHTLESYFFRTLFIILYFLTIFTRLIPIVIVTLLGVGVLFFETAILQTESNVSVIWNSMFNFTNIITILIFACFYLFNNLYSEIRIINYTDLKEKLLHREIKKRVRVIFIGVISPILILLIIFSLLLITMPSFQAGNHLYDILANNYFVFTATSVFAFLYKVFSIDMEHNKSQLHPVPSSPSK